jgi:hypothetical protein
MQVRRARRSNYSPRFQYPWNLHAYSTNASFSLFFSQPLSSLCPMSKRWCSCSCSCVVDFLSEPQKKSQSHPNTPTHARDAHDGKKEMLGLWYRGDSNPRGLLHENASSEEDKLALESHAITTRPRYLILYDKEIKFTINITRLTTKRQLVAIVIQKTQSGAVSNVGRGALAKEG